MLKKLILAATFSILVAPFSMAHAEAPNWQMRQDESRIEFASTENGRPVQHTIDDFKADIRFSPEDLENSAVKVIIPVKSIQRADQEALLTLQEDNFFDMKNAPNIFFTADRFRMTGDQAYVANGTLTIKNMSLPLELPFKLDIDGNVARMSSSVVIKRLAYEIGTGSWSDTDFIADEVDVKITVVADRLTDN